MPLLHSFRVAVRPTSARARARRASAAGPIRTASRSERPSSNAIPRPTTKARVSVADGSLQLWWQELAAWWNEHLRDRVAGARDPSSGNLGQLLSELADQIAGSEGRNDSQSRLTAMLSSMELLRMAGVGIVGIHVSPQGFLMRNKSAPDDRDGYECMARQLTAGDPMAVEALTWSLILHVEVCQGSSRQSSNEALAELLGWVRIRTSDYQGVSVGNTRAEWSRSFHSGLAWCALLHSHSADLLSFSDKMGDDVSPDERLRCVFEAASANLGVCAPFRITGISQAIEEEPRLAILYTARIRNAMQRAEELGWSVARTAREHIMSKRGSLAPLRCREVLASLRLSPVDESHGEHNPSSFWGPPRLHGSRSENRSNNSHDSPRKLDESCSENWSESSRDDTPLSIRLCKSITTESEGSPRLTI